LHASAAYEFQNRQRDSIYSFAVEVLKDLETSFPFVHMQQNFRENILEGHETESDIDRAIYIRCLQDPVHASKILLQQNHGETRVRKF
jgi:hypothetical protein